MTVRAANLNVTCLPLSGSSTDALGGSSSADKGAGGSNGGVPGYVWAVVGVAAAVAVALAVAAVLLTRRRRLRRAGIGEGPAKDLEIAVKAVTPLPPAGEAMHEDDISSYNSLATSTELQEGLWRNRCLSRGWMHDGHNAYNRHVPATSLAALHMSCNPMLATVHTVCFTHNLCVSSHPLQSPKLVVHSATGLALWRGSH